MNVIERKKIIYNFIELEKERDELQKELSEKEKQMKKIKLDIEYSEEELNRVSKSSVQNFFVGLMGKKESRIQEAENTLRKVRSEMITVEFENTSMKNRLESILEELAETEPQVFEYIKELSEVEDGTQIREDFLLLQKMHSLINEIDKKIIELKPLFKRAEEIYIYGDIQADLSGRRYNRKDTTLREQTYKIKPVLNELLELIKEYTAIVPEMITFEYHEKWMDNTEFWEGQQLAEDSYERVKKVDDWFFQFDSLWKKLNRQQDEIVQQLQDRLLESLV